MHDPFPLQYGAAEARAPSAAIARPVLLVVGILHALSAAAAVVPYVAVSLFQLDAGRWTFLFAQPTEVLISGAAMCAVSLAFVLVCSAALIRPAGIAAQWVATAAFAYVGVWLVDGMSSGILPLVSYTIRGRAPPLTWLNYVSAASASLCRELGQASLLLLILYAFGRRTPPEARVLRAVPIASIAVCTLQVLMRVFQTLDMYASRYALLPWGRRLSLLLRDDSMYRFWTVGASYLLVCLLALGAFRRRPRLAGTLILVPFLVVEPIARGTLWTAFNVTSLVERTMTLTYDLAFLIFSATTPIAAFVLFTLLGRQLPDDEYDMTTAPLPAPGSPGEARR